MNTITEPSVEDLIAEWKAKEILAVYRWPKWCAVRRRDRKHTYITREQADAVLDVLDPDNGGTLGTWSQLLE